MSDDDAPVNLSDDKFKFISALSMCNNEKVKTFMNNDEERERFLNATTTEKYSPLTLAAMGKPTKPGSKEVFELVTEGCKRVSEDFYKKKLQEKDRWGNNQVAVVLGQSENIELIKQVIEAHKTVFGGDEYLKKALMAPNDQDGATTFAAAVGRCSDPTVFKFIIELYKSFGDDFLKSAIETKDKNGNFPLATVAKLALKTDTLELFINTIKAVGCDVNHQLNFKNDTDGCNVLLAACQNSSSAEVPQFFLDMIGENKDAITSKSKTGVSGFHYLCKNTKSIETLKKFIALLKKVGGDELVKENFAAAPTTTKDDNNTLKFVCKNENYGSGKIIDFVCANLIKLGLFDAQLSEISEDEKESLDENFGVCLEDIQEKFADMDKDELEAVAAGAVKE